MEGPNLQAILDAAMQGEMQIELEITADEATPTSSAETPSSVTDAVTQTNVKVVGESPALAEADLHQVLSQSASLTSQNAVNAQKQLTTTHQAAA